MFFESILFLFYRSGIQISSLFGGFVELSLIPFEPFPLLTNNVTQTVLGSKFSGDTTLPPRIAQKIRLHQNCVLVCFEIPPPSAGAPLVILLHGMGGCSESAYMRRIARKLHGAGFGVFMVNHRGSGPGMGLADRLWNGGSSGDLAEIVEFAAATHKSSPLLLAGFSLSGNILLKYLGEEGRVPAKVFAALAVNPSVDLQDSSRRISEGPLADIFNGYYMKLLLQQVLAMKECFPDTFSPRGKPETIYQFDTVYTAPAAGFSDVEDYYQRCSALQFLGGIRVPTTILCSKDDPFVSWESIENGPKSLCVQTFYTEHGGHMGYLSSSKLPAGDRRWMDYFLVEWARHCVPNHQGEADPGPVGLAAGGMLA